MRPFLCLLLLGLGVGGVARAEMMDMTKAVVVTPPGLTGPAQKAVEMLVDEVYKRTWVRWEVTNQGGPVTDRPSIMVAPATVEGKSPVPEAYHIDSLPGPKIVVGGEDGRGVLFGVGRLLRELRMTRGSVLLPNDFSIHTAPAYGLRGHQLGYRPKVNTYDGWTPEMYEQYIRDLAVFGANAIELMPPRTDDAADSPHFTLSQIDMMAAVSGIADAYGIGLWIWYPAMDRDYSKPETVDKALAEWGDVFARLPRIDAVFVPGGDPGHTQPKYLMALLEKETEVLHRTHPDAEMWMSPQSFTPEWMAEFLEIMKGEPAWLTGLVYGPQNRIGLPELRAAAPAKYPIRHYPDITHSIRCQFAVPDWDVAYAITEEREVINPRPEGYARICRQFDEYTPGFLTYSEGCNDDVNKAVWSALGWDPEADVAGILREYARYFVGPAYEESFGQVLLGLERNWQGPLLTNAGVETTLQQMQQIQAEATPQVLLSWRFQQAVYRAYYDGFLRSRLIYETGLEEQAMQALRNAAQTGPSVALAQAEAILERAVAEPAAQDLRARVFEMAEALYQSIRMQLSVPRYQAIDAGRGGNLDLIDRPLNNRNWLEAQFDEIRAIKSPRQQLERIDAIVNWTNPGPGGYYDDLGDVANQRRLVRLDVEDPEFRTTPRTGFSYSPDYRMSWVRFAETIYETPLAMQYDGLDANSAYKVRVTYSGDRGNARIRLTADGGEIHPYKEKEFPIRPQEFDVPKETTADSKLTLAFQQEPGGGGSGRGCQVAEVWLIRK